MLLERFKEGIEVTHNKDDSKKKKNKNRREAIQEYFGDNYQLNKEVFKSFLKSKSSETDSSSLIEKVNEISFKNANPRNNFLVNELTFAGEGIAEGFLECFQIEKDTAIEKYEKQLQMIEKKEDGKSQYYIGTFKEDKLLRATPYQENKEDLLELLEKQANNRKQKQEQQISRSRRKED